MIEAMVIILYIQVIPANLNIIMPNKQASWKAVRKTLHRLT